MVRFAKLRLTTGDFIWINPKTVQAVSGAKYEGQQVTIVAFPDGPDEFIRVAGAPELTVKVLEEAGM